MRKEKKRMNKRPEMGTERAPPPETQRTEARDRGQASPTIKDQRKSSDQRPMTSKSH